MQNRIQIIFLRNLGKFRIQCGHSKTETIKDEDGRSGTCPDIGEYYQSKDNFRRCSEGVKVYIDFKKENLTLHLPADASSEEKIVLTYQQIELKKRQLKAEVFFEKSPWGAFAHGTLNDDPFKIDKERIKIVLFKKELPNTLQPVEKRYYENLIKKLPPGLIGVYADKIILLEDYFGM